MATDDIPDLILSLVEADGDSLRLPPDAAKKLESRLRALQGSEALVDGVVRIAQVVEVLDRQFHATAAADAILEVTARILGPDLHRAAVGNHHGPAADLLKQLGVDASVFQERTAPAEGEAKAGPLARFQLKVPPKDG